MEAGKYPLNEIDLKKYYEVNYNSHNSFYLLSVIRKISM